MEYKVVDKKKDFIEVELSDKSLVYALLPILTSSGVDAYSYSPHPLKPGIRLCIKSENPVKDFAKAVDNLSKDWGKFRKAVEGSIPKK